MPALRMHASIYAHGMSAPTYACMTACVYASLMPCAPPHHAHRGGGGDGISPMGGAHLRYILWAPPLPTPHPTGEGGGSITITTPYPLVGGGGEPLAPTQDINIYIYICCLGEWCKHTNRTLSSTSLFAEFTLLQTLPMCLVNSGNGNFSNSLAI